MGHLKEEGEQSRVEHSKEVVMRDKLKARREIC